VTKPRDIETIATRLAERLPDVTIEQIKVAHPGADDDGLWFVHHPAAQFEAQLASTTGNSPFLIESDGTREAETAHTVDQAIAAVERRLGIRPD
jgi:hypothetical protein